YSRAGRLHRSEWPQSLPPPRRVPASLDVPLSTVRRARSCRVNRPSLRPPLNQGGSCLPRNCDPERYLVSRLESPPRSSTHHHPPGKRSHARSNGPKGQSRHHHALSANQRVPRSLPHPARNRHHASDHAAFPFNRRPLEIDQQTEPIAPTPANNSAVN